MNTDRLIEQLARDTRPVRPLPRPWVRAAAWLMGALLYVALLTAAMTSGADLEATGWGWRFAFPQLAALATAVAAAAAAFASTVPGHSRRAIALAIVAAVTWVAGLVFWSLEEWSQGTVSIAASREWLCVAMIVGGGVVPAVALMAMLRRGAPLAPAVTAALGVLAVAALGNVGACLSHPHPSHAVTLIWHGATIASVVALAALTGPALLRWNRVRV